MCYTHFTIPTFGFIKEPLLPPVVILGSDFTSCNLGPLILTVVIVGLGFTDFIHGFINRLVLPPIVMVGCCYNGFTLNWSKRPKNTVFLLLVSVIAIVPLLLYLLRCLVLLSVGGFIMCN